MNNLENIGLFLNLVGAIILVIPVAKFKRSFHIDKDKIIELNRKDEELLYTTKRDQENARLALVGIILMIFGFIFQLLAQFN